MGNRLEVSDMPPLTLEMHSDLRGLERKLQIALSNCCSSRELLDPHAAFEYVRTYSIQFYDCFYGFYSEYPDPAYRRHWQSASEKFAFDRIVQCIQNDYFVAAYFSSDTTLVTRIRRTIKNHAERTVRNSISNAPLSTSPADSIGAQLAKLLEESRLTREYVAEQIGIDKRNVFRHLRGIVPRARQIAAYETFFTERLKKPIKLKTS